MSKYIASKKLLYTDPEKLLQDFAASTGEEVSEELQLLVKGIYSITDRFREVARRDRAANRAAAKSEHFENWIQKNPSGFEDVDELLLAMIVAGYYDGYNEKGPCS
ncbi:MAG: hypothetical protein IJ347_07080 [Faecalibacterium sp.]|nr:hypothetical protein [Faecalibacterium sp.]